MTTLAPPPPVLAISKQGLGKIFDRQGTGYTTIIVKLNEITHKSPNLFFNYLCPEAKGFNSVYLYFFL